MFLLLHLSIQVCISLYQVALVTQCPVYWYNTLLILSTAPVTFRLFCLQFPCPNLCRVVDPVHRPWNNLGFVVYLIMFLLFVTLGWKIKLFCCPIHHLRAINHRFRDSTVQKDFESSIALTNLQWVQ